MIVANVNNVRIRVPDALKAEWDKVLEDHKISQQDAVTALMQWIGDQDAIVRAMIFKQIPASPDLVRGAIERLGKATLRKAGSPK